MYTPMMHIAAASNEKNDQKKQFTPEQLLFNLPILTQKEEKIIKNPNLTKETFRETAFYQELVRLYKSEELKLFAEEPKKSNRTKKPPLSYFQDKLPDFESSLGLKTMKISWFLDDELIKHSAGLSVKEHKNRDENFIVVRFVNPYTEKLNFIVCLDLMAAVDYLVKECRFMNLLPYYMYLCQIMSAKMIGPKGEAMSSKIQLKSFMDAKSHYKISISDKEIGILEVPLIATFSENITADDIWCICEGEIILKPEIISLLDSKSASVPGMKFASLFNLVRFYIFEKIGEKVNLIEEE